jgi:hypothetical protein
MSLSPKQPNKKGPKKPYSKPELQVYGNLAEITNSSTNRTGKKTDQPGCHTGRTH